MENRDNEEMNQGENLMDGIDENFQNAINEIGAFVGNMNMQPNQLINLQNFFNQNLNLAKVVTNFGMMRDDRDRFFSTNGFIKYNIQRLGLTVGNFTVSIVL